MKIQFKERRSQL
jgi:hypothetical protein